jgi:hypothetical protein
MNNDCKIVLSRLIVYLMMYIMEFGERRLSVLNQIKPRISRLDFQHIRAVDT